MWGSFNIASKSESEIVYKYCINCVASEAATLTFEKLWIGSLVRRVLLGTRTNPPTVGFLHQKLFSESTELGKLSVSRGLTV